MASTKVTYTLTTVWKDRKRAHHKTGEAVLECDFRTDPFDDSIVDDKAIRYWLADALDVDDDNMLQINRVETLRS